MNSRINVTIGSLLLAATTLVGCSGSGSMNSSAYSSPTSPSTTTASIPAPPAATPNTPVSTSTDYPAPTPGDVPAVADVIITINGMDAAQPFSPNPVTIKAGQTVSWVNKDSVPHTATSNTGAFTTGVISPGTTSEPIAMGSTGTFGYHCGIHPSMTGSLLVVAAFF